MATYENFPLDSGIQEFGTSYKFNYSVAEAKTASGLRFAMTHQTQPGLSFSVKFPMLTRSQLQTFIEFYQRCSGSLTPFYYSDYLQKRKGEQLVYNDGKWYFPASGLPVSKASDIANLTADGVKKTATGERTYLTISGTTSSSVVLADYKAWVLVHFVGDLQITEKFDDWYQVSVQLEVVRI